MNGDLSMLRGYAGRVSLVDEASPCLLIALDLSAAKPGPQFFRIDFKPYDLDAEGNDPSDLLLSIFQPFVERRVHAAAAFRKRPDAVEIFARVPGNNDQVRRRGLRHLRHKHSPIDWIGISDGGLPAASPSIPPDGAAAGDYLGSAS
jgi:hypothetical protein